VPLFEKLFRALRVPFVWWSLGGFDVVDVLPHFDLLRAQAQDFLQKSELLFALAQATLKIGQTLEHPNVLWSNASCLL
jgi:hypothetical protein